MICERWLFEITDGLERSGQRWQAPRLQELLECFECRLEGEISSSCAIVASCGSALKRIPGTCKVLTCEREDVLKGRRGNKSEHKRVDGDNTGQSYVCQY